MNELKDKISTVAIFIFIVAGGLTVICKVFNELIPAILWVISFDFKDTGLAFIEETIIKAIVESIIVIIAASYGISEKNPFVTIVIIFAGFVSCMAFYFIKQHLLWIMIGVIILFVAYIVFLIVLNCKKTR